MKLNARPRAPIVKPKAVAMAELDKSGWDKEDNWEAEEWEAPPLEIKTESKTGGARKPPKKEPKGGSSSWDEDEEVRVLRVAYLRVCVVCGLGGGPTL
jgi:hypothetical protein